MPMGPTRVTSPFLRSRIRTKMEESHAVSVGCGHRERAAEANVARMGVIVVLGTDASRAGIQSRAGREPARAG